MPRLHLFRSILPKLFRLFSQNPHQQKGSTLLEYGAMIAVVASIALATLLMFFPKVIDLFSFNTPEVSQSEPNRPRPTAPRPSAPEGPWTPNWTLTLQPNLLHPLGGYLPATWIPLEPIQVTRPVTIVGDDTVRVSVNGEIVPHPTSAAPGDTLVFEVLTPPTFETEGTWTVVVNDTPLSVNATTRPTPDTTPDLFVFPNIDSPTSNTPVLSTPIPITGVEPGIEVGGTTTGPGTPLLSVNGGPWTETVALQNGDTLQVKVNSPPPGQTHSVTVTVGGMSGTFTVNTPPEPRVQPFTFGEVTLAWNNTTWRVTSPYVTIQGLNNIFLPFTVTGTGNPMAQSNVPNGPAASGTVTNGTTLQIDAPPPTGSAIGTLTIDGRSGSFRVFTQPIPHQTINHNGQLWLWIPVHWQGRSFSVSGGGNAGAAPDGNITPATTLPNSRITSGTVRNGFNLVVDAPPRGQHHTLTITIDGVASTFLLSRP